MNSNSQSSRKNSLKARAGRALVECIVAMFLLAVTSLSMAATVHGTLALADDASLVTHAQSLATTRVEDALALPCGSGLSGFDHQPRLGVLWQQGGSSRTTQLHLDLTLDRSPIGFASSPMSFGIEAGGICP